MALAQRWIEQGYSASLVLHFVGIKSSTYYYNTSKPSANIQKGGPGRPVLGYSLTTNGEKISDEQIEEYLMELISGDGFPYGYKKLTVCLQEDYNLIINHKKVYRLCKKMGILKPQRKLKTKHPRKLAKRREITGSNKLWQMDVKYGYIYGIDRFFFLMSIIDVYDRNIVSYHIGLRAQAADAERILKEALLARGLIPRKHEVFIRTDNGPQFVAHKFKEACTKLGIKHERIPNRTPNMNAFIESFHAILEDDCLTRHEFNTYAEAYKAVSEYIQYYNTRRRHGSLKYKAPLTFYLNNIGKHNHKVMIA